MNTRDYHARAVDNVSQTAREEAIEFNNRILEDRVWAHIEESCELHELHSAIEQCYDVSRKRTEKRDGRDALSTVAHTSAEHMSEHVDTVVLEIVAQAVADTIEHVEDDRGFYDADVAADAIGEAREWLDNHPRVCDRLGIETADAEGELVTDGGVEVSRTVYKTTVAGMTVSTTDADAATEWSESGLRVTAETGSGL